MMNCCPIKLKERSGDRRAECVGDECVRMRAYLAKFDEIFRRTAEEYSNLEGVRPVPSVEGFAFRLMAFSWLLEELSGASQGVLDRSAVKALKSVSAAVDMDVGCMMVEFEDGFKVPISENYPATAEVRAG